MIIIQHIKNFLKRILPPPTNSFMREINILKKELSKLLEEQKKAQKEDGKLLEELGKIREENERQFSELKRIHEENKKQLDELSKLREENGKLLRELEKSNVENIKHLDELSRWHNDKLNSITDKSNACMRAAKESVWAEVFNNTITGSVWLKNQTFSPGRWALGYQALYVLYRVLNGARPKHILELGLGQSTNMITQYVATENEVEHFVVEHDSKWIKFYKREYPLAKQTEIVQLDRTFEPYKDAEKVRVYSNFKERFSGKVFDFVVIDAPLGGDMKQYARIDILKLLPECLSESFTILFDDTQRSGEANTVKEICSALEEAGIEYEKGNYIGDKTCTVICSKGNAFLTTL